MSGGEFVNRLTHGLDAFEYGHHQGIAGRGASDVAGFEVVPNGAAKTKCRGVGLQWMRGEFR